MTPPLRAVPAAVRALAERTRGFMPPEEGRALYHWAHEAPDGPMLEIGSWCGMSALYLGSAAAARGTLLVTVDHHRGSEENGPGWEHHDPEVVDPRTGRTDTLPFLRRTLEDAGLEDVVVPVVGESTAVASLWRVPLALLFIDGGHGSAPAHADFEQWSPWVRPGGLLLVHDVFPDPAAGGRPPYEVYLKALDSGFTEVSVHGSLRVLRRDRAGAPGA